MSKKKKEKKSVPDIYIHMNGGESPFGQSVSNASGWDNRPRAEIIKERIKELYEELEKTYGSKDI